VRDLSPQLVQGINSRLASVRRSGIRVVSDLAQRPGVLHLEIGQPDFPTPAHIVAAAHRAARDGLTGYTSNAGLSELRSALRDKLAEENGVQATTEQIVVTVGAMGALYAAQLAVLEPGDQLLVPDPGYPNYRMVATLCDAEVVSYPLLPEQGYQPDLEALAAAITPRAKAIVINSPSNPTGGVMSRAALEGLVELAERHDLYVLSDECYERILFEGEHVSPASLGGTDRFFTIGSFSKTYAMTGWRVGYVVAPVPVAPMLIKLQEATVACAPVLSQHAALAALTGPQDAVAAMCAAYRRRRDLALSLLEPEGLCRYRPGGAFYLLVDLPGEVADTSQYARDLLAATDVAAAPGETFGAGAAGRLRISLATNEEVLTEGIERLLRFARDRAG
jgi:aspartate aminotransferase